MERLSGQQLIQQAAELISQNKLDEAVKIFSFLVEKLPDAPLPLLIQLERYEEALVDAKKILDLPNIPIADEIAPGNSTLHSVGYVRAAKCYKELGQIEEAERLLKKRVEIEKKEVKPKPIKEMLSEEKDKNASVPTSSPNKSVERLRLQGNQYYKSQKYEASLNSYLEALEIDPNDLLVNSNCAQSLIKLGRLDDALVYAENCIRLNMKWSKGYYRKGCILFEQKKYQLAISAFTAAKVYGADESDIDKKTEIARKHLKSASLDFNSRSSITNFITSRLFSLFAIIIIAILSAVLCYHLNYDIFSYFVGVVRYMFDAYFGDI
ncbi:7627_t:CDS:2, partial [Acaulospora morrowiae]